MTLLKDIAQIEKGRKYNLLEENQEGAIRVFQANDFRNENKPLYTLDSDGVLAEEDDILLVWDGSVGQMGFGRTGYVGSTMVKLKVKNKNRFSPFFIYRFLQTKSEYLKRKATGATIMHINRKSLEQLELPDLEIDDQLHIANLLSKAENLIAQRKESIRLLDEFLKSTFLEMFGDPVKNEKGWEIVGIESVCDDIFLGLTNKVDYVDDGGFPLVRATDIRDGKLSFENVKYISENQHRKITKNRISKRGDILVSKSGTLGTTAIVDDDREFTTYESIITIQPSKGKLINYFLNFLLRNTNFQIKMLGGKTGGTVGHLNLLMFRGIELPLPPFERQTQFAQIVEKTEALKTQYQQSLQELENLYGSLSQKAFNGELSLK